MSRFLDWLYGPAIKPAVNHGYWAQANGYAGELCSLLARTVQAEPDGPCKVAYAVVVTRPDGYFRAPFPGLLPSDRIAVTVPAVDLAITVGLLRVGDGEIEGVAYLANGATADSFAIALLMIAAGPVGVSVPEETQR